MRGPRGGSRRSDSAGSEKVKDERADELKAARYHSMIIIILITMQHRFIQVLVFYVYQNSAIFLIYCYYVFFVGRARILSIGQQPPHFLKLLKVWNPFKVHVYWVRITFILCGWMYDITLNKYSKIAPFGCLLFLFWMLLYLEIFRIKYLWNRLRETILDTVNASLENDVKERYVSHGVHFQRQVMHRNPIITAFHNSKTDVSN